MMLPSVFLFEFITQKFITMEKIFYTAPEIEVQSIAIEKGFAVTGDPSDMEFGGDLS